MSQTTFREKTPSELRAFVLDPATTNADVQAYWVALQRHRRDAGRAHYTALIDPITDTAVCTI